MLERHQALRRNVSNQSHAPASTDRDADARRTVSALALETPGRCKNDDEWQSLLRSKRDSGSAAASGADREAEHIQGIVDNGLARSAPALALASAPAPFDNEDKDGVELNFTGVCTNKEFAGPQAFR